MTNKRVVDLVVDLLGLIGDTDDELDASVKAICQRASQLEAELDKHKAKILALQEFAIWMTGCGYDFAQHPHFVDQRNRLLKEPITPPEKHHTVELPKEIKNGDSIL